MRNALWNAAAIVVGLTVGQFAFAGSTVRAAFAADIRVVKLDPDGLATIRITGEIERGDADRYLSIWKMLRERYSHPAIAVVSLNSLGGVALEAATLAGYIRATAASTMVTARSTCASACVLMLLAGRAKIVISGTRVGVHSAVSDAGETIGARAFTTDLARAYADFGLASDVIGRVVTTTPGSVYWLTEDDLRRSGVGVLPPNWSEDSSWKPAPGANPIDLSQIKSAQTSQPSLSPAERSVFAYLDSAPELKSRWRVLNEDKGFLAWLDMVDPLFSEKRIIIMHKYFREGKATGVEMFFRRYINEHPNPSAGDMQYTYVPSGRDRAEIRSCVASANAQTTYTDCVMPSVNKIVSELLDDTVGSSRMPRSPQLANMFRVAAAFCGLSADNPAAPVTDAARPCLESQIQKISLAIATGLRDVLAEAVKR
jgi:hypothetical protein